MRDISAESDAEYAKYAAEYAAKYAKSAVEYAEYAAKYAEYTAKSAAEYAESAESAAKSAAMREEIFKAGLEFLEAACPKHEQGELVAAKAAALVCTFESAQA
jgi:hypothetical protein